MDDFFKFLLYYEVLKFDRILNISSMYRMFRDRRNTRGYGAYEKHTQYARTR